VTTPAAATTPPPPVARKLLPFMLAAVAAMTIGGWVGQSLLATLSNDAPLLLIVLNPRNSFLLLVSQSVPAWAFFAVGFLRLVAGDPVFYALGYWYGERARQYVKDNGAYAGVIAWVDRWFPKVGPVFVFAAPNQMICLLAGTSRMSVRLFAVLNVSGTVVRLVLIYWLGRVFRSELESVLDFLGRYQWQVTIVIVVLTIAQSMWSQRRNAATRQ
jgi:membrane protein DedA with SNARE-associated domain